ncbi:hypothetical protein NDU88_005407 [Pleurodeles waltl]|uniref:Uncharacterized protein n=1 Tax=Pleurodeles waltl TaxID=8319 RepID=A0AAV7PI06_PLEWA|nr:hypothetical protein NDU88_005407 [Pleurodeles waltl]
MAQPNFQSEDFMLRLPCGQKLDAQPYRMDAQQNRNDAAQLPKRRIEVAPGMSQKIRRIAIPDRRNACDFVPLAQEFHASPLGVKMIPTLQ